MLIPISTARSTMIIENFSGNGLLAASAVLFVSMFSHYHLAFKS